MDRNTATDELNSALVELEELHEREAAILKGMDPEALDSVTAEKEALCARLREAISREAPTQRHRAILDRLRHRATLNQLLIVHARDAVRSILSEASGTPAAVEGPIPGTRQRVVQDGLRVDVRG